MLNDVLNYCNKIREQHDLPALTELPKGVKGSPRECVIARACYGQMGFKTLTINEKSIRVPLYIVDFIEYFDDGLFPELEEK